MTTAFAGLFLVSALARADARLRDRLPESTRIQIEALLDSAVVESLPTEPIVQRALEGVTKGAEGSRIAQAAQALLSRLRQSRRVLGARAPAEELVLSAHCLQAGTDTTSLRLLAMEGKGRSLVTPLLVLADLIGRGAPVELAFASTMSLVRADVREAAFLEFRARVEEDILSGVAPTDALTRRVDGVLDDLPSPEIDVGEPNHGER